ncbi:PREDICTED: 28S ribosomal protein S21, mitochondrial [Papilio xuthus]|uniref:28S ribosomal protein S21, mitochondrial n=1 Tax=Papilio xuthus TaxID=66420 RepID=A0A194PVW2_PAPXU|nr:PREDICTED: 28S ribosomal protein S21, mitochondrial [Papilio xuthus]KPI96899.1 28S ribosomal protein S21, mitochondrial [Papilio xuthus]
MFLTLKLLANRHPSFIARTVFVKNNNVDDACRLVNRILGKEGILEQFRLTRYYEKPFQTRRRVNHEKCKAIYNEDMERKIHFVLRKNRHEPFPGCH